MQLLYLSSLLHEICSCDQLVFNDEISVMYSQRNTVCTIMLQQPTISCKLSLIQLSSLANSMHNYVMLMRETKTFLQDIIFSFASVGLV